MGNHKDKDEFGRSVPAMATAASRNLIQRERDSDIAAEVIHTWQQRYRVQDATHDWASNGLAGDCTPSIESG
jgi:hypothetical protein